MKEPFKFNIGDRVKFNGHRGTVAGRYFIQGLRTIHGSIVTFDSAVDARGGTFFSLPIHEGHLEADDS